MMGPIAKQDPALDSSSLKDLFPSMDIHPENSYRGLHKADHTLQEKPISVVIYNIK